MCLHMHTVHLLAGEGHDVPGVGGCDVDWGGPLPAQWAGVSTRHQSSNQAKATFSALSF